MNGYQQRFKAQAQTNRRQNANPQEKESLLKSETPRQHQTRLRRSQNPQGASPRRKLQIQSPQTEGRQLQLGLRSSHPQNQNPRRRLQRLQQRVGENQDTSQKLHRPD